MSLSCELKFKSPIEILEHEAVLNIYYTASKIKKRADKFFAGFGLTDVQFNILMLLANQAGQSGGLTQAQIGEMMLVNRANVTALVDRMEKAALVERAASANDRRSNLIKMTGKGKRLFDKVEPLYYKEIEQLMAGINAAEQKKINSILERIRAGLCD